MAIKSIKLFTERGLADEKCNVEKPPDAPKHQRLVTEAKVEYLYFLSLRISLRLVRCFHQKKKNLTRKITCWFKLKAFG